MDEVVLLKKVGVMVLGLLGLLGISEGNEILNFNKMFKRSKIGVFGEVKGFGIIVEYLYKLNWKNVFVFNMKCLINLVRY